MSARFYDTLIWEYINNPGQRWFWLDKLANKEFNYKMISFKEITSNWKITFDKINLNAAATYSWEDVFITNKLYNSQNERWITKNEVLNNIEIPLLEVLKKMEITWVKIDRDKLKGIWILLENEINNLEKSIFELTWEEFNIKSPKQVWEILFNKLALPKWKKTKTWWSVSADVLWELSHDYPVAQKIVDYRHYTKLLSTYIDWLIDLLDEDDFVHTSYNQTVTATWRLSSTSPNLQNIPSSSGIAWEIRGAFISRFEKWSIIAIDYSQVELRLLAILSNDKNLIEAFKNNKDIHHTTAQFIFNKDWHDNITITNSQRKIAKAVNFWVVYGISAFWLSKMIWIWVKEAKNYINTFFEIYPNVKEYLNQTIKFCEDNKYVETIFKRRRYINWINDSNKMIKSSAEREAINMPIQWSNADIIKIAMIKSMVFLNKNSIKSKMIMQVHDELVFDVAPWEENIIKKEITKIMENILIWKEIILKIDIWEWKTWKEAK